MADITYGNNDGDYLMLGQMAWSVSWGLFDERYADKLEIIKQQKWYDDGSDYDFESILNTIHENKNGNALVDWTHFSATLLTILTGEVKINHPKFGELELKLPHDTLFDNGSGWLGDFFTTAGVDDLNADYLAIVVANDIQAGINPIISIDIHYQEIVSDPIETWSEFFERLK